MNVYGKILSYFPFFSFFIFTYRMDQKKQRMKIKVKLNYNGDGDLSYLKYLQRLCGSHFQACYGSNTSVQSCDDFTVFAFQPSTAL